MRQHLLDLDAAFLGDGVDPAPAQPLLDVGKVTRVTGKVAHHAFLIEEQREVTASRGERRRGFEVERAKPLARLLEASHLVATG
ncbi:hypothetical protein GCM10022281_15870 [Sphingomonas rosea]|uniref:Uncharacterized protein n=1 Tax=Sphingomonas rosea TaxID=335605 RepID=A0ABP7U5A0_9SPHN